MAGAHLSKKRDKDVVLAISATANRIRPLHLVNAVVNDLGSKRLEWRDRLAAPFTLSALHYGSTVTNYRRTNADSPGAMTMGRAMAISGAAANPSMGYFSSAPVRWLMGFFNLRLGWWLRNPRDRTHLDAEPRSALSPYFEELRGTSGVHSKYINLSDGGHFDNLGLYEAIRRNCRYIVAVDASYDPDGRHLDLARAERLIRIDLGVELAGRRRNTSATIAWRASRIRVESRDI